MRQPARTKEEKAIDKDIEAIFGKKIAKQLVDVPVIVHYEDLRTEEQKHLVEKLKKESEEYQRTHPP
ncbi:MAG: hypothetical protein GYA24_13390 [Candidatus Lokiarchaeota archaeon]|nr:hypothetical protein [Candidatus Lokiarchaeota archaeon]